MGPFAERAQARSLTFVGASARALAWSARRAGFRGDAFDLFRDMDLCTIAQVTAIPANEWPRGLLAHDLKTDQPLLYGGALENEPYLLAQLAARVPLYGVTGEGLRGVREPETVESVLRDTGLPCPRVRDTAEGLPRDGSWLAKPRASAGGRRVLPLDRRDYVASADTYYQERIEGAPCSAVYVGRGADARCRMIGATRQLIGRVGAPFVYRGSIGPIRLAAETRHVLEELGDVLARRFVLRGLFGVDFILRGAVPWPVEINPRYAASVEVLELASQRALLGEHVGAFTNETSDANQLSIDDDFGRYVGKCIIYAPGNCRLSGASERFLLEVARRQFERGPFEVFSHADIPAPGSRFVGGAPVLTILAQGSTFEVCRRRLHAREQRWIRRLQHSVELAENP